MSLDAAGPVILSRKYSATDQDRFAVLSGDRNPLHMDPVLARRTLQGAPVVHGLNLALTALEVLLDRRLAKGNGDASINTLAAQFTKPVFVGEKVRFHLNGLTAEQGRVFGSVDDMVVFRVTVGFGPARSLPAGPGLPELVAEPAAQTEFEALSTARGELALGLEAGLAGALFPGALRTLGGTGLAEVLALTRLVGMRCPGLHSLFSAFAVGFEISGARDSLGYRVEEADPRYRRLSIQVEGARLKGTVEAFVRPAPETQPAMTEVARVVPSGSFSNSVALVVGGSRGLGEITAKIIAAGGGLPVITYFQGQADAERVVAEIRGWGGRCDLTPLDVRRAGPVVRRLFRRKTGPRSIYYFATPKIRGRRRSFFSYELLEEFNEYYVNAFGRLIDAAGAVTGNKLRVFYPSSTAVDQEMSEMAEYSIAKRAAEEVCAFYNRHSPKIEVLVERLPRIKTDQNMTLLPVPAEEALNVMLPIVQRTEAMSSKG